MDDKGIVMFDITKDIHLIHLTQSGKALNDELRRRETTPLAIEDRGPCVRAAASARACEAAARGAGEAQHLVRGKLHHVAPSRIPDPDPVPLVELEL